MNRTGFDTIKGVCEHCKRELERLRYYSLTSAQRSKRGKKANRHAKKRREQALHYIERQRNTLDKQNKRIMELEDKIQRHRYKNAPSKQTINGNPAVDITPFRMWLLRQYREHDYNISELAEAIGQSTNMIKHWLDGFYWNGAGRDPVPVRSIDLYKVDAIAVNVGDTGLLERLYPLEEDANV